MSLQQEDIVTRAQQIELLTNTCVLTSTCPIEAVGYQNAQRRSLRSSQSVELVVAQRAPLVGVDRLVRPVEVEAVG